MLLSLLIIIPFLSGVFSFFSYRFGANIPRWISLIGVGSTLLIILKMCLKNRIFQAQKYPFWNDQLIIPWIPRFGIDFNIAIDGFSLVMLVFSLFLGFVSILCAWNEIKRNEGLFYLNLMFLLTGAVGVFIAIDLFLFFFFWEMMLIPTYFLIMLWGKKKDNKKNHIYSANKFFLYSQLSGLIMLISILGLVFLNYQNTNILTFNYNFLLNQTIDEKTEYILMLGFFLAFAIKMPIVPFHGWLPDAHSASPVCGSVDLAGILLKTAPYSLLRYNFTLFPNSTSHFVPVAMFLGIFSLFYGAWLAFSQTNIKRFIAYSSISHMGLTLIAIYSANKIALGGAVIQMLSNSVSASALCILSGQLYNRLETQDMRKMRGLWTYMYWIPGFILFFSLSNLGIPGTGNFIGEFLILFGVFQSFPEISVLSTLVIIFSSIYSLKMIQTICYGQSQRKFSMFFLSKYEFFIILLLVLILIFFGINSNQILEISCFSINNLYKKFTESVLTMRL
ncbi:NADH-quinone oxidoreductase subunit M [Buchnera aphidicola (Muscaphis stroyani)]|uniref:NADH-quinone oxidoreductase subunit M n=1 Tax=Buchnera aphidicola (Muscaphis stroyani) TaxID=1241869 RepID=A0A4D6Y769_9GAMM|nr:NADH-quinone oxidoreductase subunit M [Buchnera aphidicola]QCI24263.1 NADH-quinone oxidoreductase subunit M [Buchnera aphidicola (Muscaphis stroyani)]